MESEHLRNVRPSWVAFGWFVGAACTALALFALIAAGLLTAAAEAEGVWVALAFALGFLAAGYLTGAVTRAAPILHAVGIGLFSLIVWIIVNLFFGGSVSEWQALSPGLAAGLLLLQIVTAAVGTWLGARTRGGATPASRTHLDSARPAAHKRAPKR